MRVLRRDVQHVDHMPKTLITLSLEFQQMSLVQMMYKKDNLTYMYESEMKEDRRL